MEDILYYMRNPLCPYKKIERKIAKQFTPINPVSGLCPARCIVCFANMCEGTQTVIETDVPEKLKQARDRIFINETCESTIPGKESLVAKFYRDLPTETNILNLETRFPCSILKLIKHFDYKRFDDFIVQISYTGFNNEFRKVFEPGTQPSESRLPCIKELIDQGINVSVRLDPLYPNYHTKERINSIVKDLSEIGVKHVTIAMLKLTKTALNRVKRTYPSLAQYYKNSEMFHQEYYLDKQIRKEIIGNCLMACKTYGVKAALCLEYKKAHRLSCGCKPDVFCEGFCMNYSD